MYEEYYCTHCGAVLNKQEGFDPSLDRWFCKECGQLLTNEEPQGSELFPDVTWFCDGCDAVLNEQEGFSDDCVEWTCTECGYVNVIAEDEIFDTTATVSHIEMTGDVEKDCQTLWNLVGRKAHVVTKKGAECFGTVCDCIPADENEDGIPSIGIVEDLDDDLEYVVSLNEIAWIDVIEGTEDDSPFFA